MDVCPSVRPSFLSQGTARFQSDAFSRDICLAYLVILGDAVCFRLSLSCIKTTHKFVNCLYTEKSFRCNVRKEIEEKADDLNTSPCTKEVQKIGSLVLYELSREYVILRYF